VSLEEIELEGDYCDDVPGLEATCSRCGHSVTVYGRSDASERAACVLLRQECPRGEQNYYAPGASYPDPPEGAMPYFPPVPSAPVEATEWHLPPFLRKKP
jgi:hypothetical protein